MGRRGTRTGPTELTSPDATQRRHWAEAAAERLLTGRGWRLLARNYRLRGGELDLVYDDVGTVVFVEVRQRATTRYGGAVESVDRRKLARLQRTAAHFLAYGPRPDGAGRGEPRVRFDAVLITGREDDHVIDHLEDVTS